MRHSRCWRRAVRALIVFVLVSLTLTGCAHYRPVPLPTAPDLATTIPDVTWKGLTGPLPDPGKVVFAPRDGLDIDETVILAVSNNPRLKAARSKRQLAGAQAFAAGLLPDPQLDLGLEQAVAATGNAVLGYSLGVSEELYRLIAHGSERQQAAQHTKQVDLDLLWQEWQVAARARELFIKVSDCQKRVAGLRELQQLYESEFERDRSGVDKGLVGQAVLAADRRDISDTGMRMHRLEIELGTNRAELTALLGLAPDLDVKLTGSWALQLPSRAEIDHAATRIADRRPDLVALRYGYASQEQAVRQAVWKQFPGLSLGVNRARDTGSVNTIGLDLSLRLPLFDRQRGVIAVQRAQRTVLKDEYQARLDQTVSDVARVVGNARLQRSYLDRQRQDYDDLQHEVEQAKTGVRLGILDQASAMRLQAQLIEQRLRIDENEAQLGQSLTMLTTMLGAPLSRQVEPKP